MANTIAGANLAAIAEETLPHLTTVFAPLRGIITDFSTDIARDGASVATRVPTVPTAADLSSGYTRSDTTTTAKTVTLDTFYGFVWGFNDVERSKSMVNLNDIFIQPCMDSLGQKVVGDLWNLVVAAAFSTSSTITAANFDRSDLADLGSTLSTTHKAPKNGRTLWAAPAHYAGLLKSMNAAEFPGQSREKAEGIAVRTSGFDCYESNILDANAENLAAFAFHRSSLLMAARGVDATKAAEAGVEVQDVVIPDLGLPIQFRRWYDPETGYLKCSVGLFYGVAVGNNMGVRVVTA